jgi:hypothetical protein
VQIEAGTLGLIAAVGAQLAAVAYWAGRTGTRLEAQDARIAELRRDLETDRSALAARLSDCSASCQRQGDAADGRRVEQLDDLRGMIRTAVEEFRAIGARLGEQLSSQSQRLRAVEEAQRVASAVAADRASREEGPPEPHRGPPRRTVAMMAADAPPLGGVSPHGHGGR